MNKAMLILFGIMIISLVVGAQWGKLPWLKNSVHGILDPTFGAMLSWNIYFGMIVIVIVMTMITTGVNKLTVNPEHMKQMKEKQKSYGEEMKLHKDNPQKLKEVQMKQLAEMPEMFSKNMEMMMKPLLLTMIPIILFFRWFSDYFITLGNPKFFGFMNWIFFYIIASILFSGIARKIYKM